MNKHIITKQQFDSLYDENITKKQYDKIIDLIDERFSEIMTTIYPGINIGRNWFDFGNVDYDSENGTGYFNPKEYKNEIVFGGSFNTDELDPFDYCIPTSWLWDADYYNHFKKAQEKEQKAEQTAKEKAEQLKQGRKSKAIKMKELISSKLSKEELRYVKFKGV